MTTCEFLVEVLVRSNVTQVFELLDTVGVGHGRSVFVQTNNMSKHQGDGSTMNDMMSTGKARQGKATEEGTQGTVLSLCTTLSGQCSKL